MKSLFLAGARPRAAAVQRDGGPGRVQAVRNQRARMRANGKSSVLFIIYFIEFRGGEQESHLMLEKQVPPEGHMPPCPL